MSPLEISAAIASALCVILAIVRNIWTYPTGIIGTILYFFVFWEAQLFSSAWLQVFFTLVQFYGWWYWLRGDRGKAPKITKLGWQWMAIAVGCVVITASFVGGFIAQHTTAKLASSDTMIFALSVLAQIGLDRKKLENWFVWIIVDLISIFVYSAAGLMVTTCLYIGFLALAIVGLATWIKSYNQENITAKPEGSY